MPRKQRKRGFDDNGFLDIGSLVKTNSSSSKKLLPGTPTTHQKVDPTKIAMEERDGVPLLVTDKNTKSSPFTQVGLISVYVVIVN